MTQPTAVILAGGLGTRIRHLLGDRPKPLAVVAGRPFLEWLIRFLAKQGFTDIIVSAGYHAEMVAAFCAQLGLENVNVRCVIEETPLGTAGGFLNAIENDRNANWLVCNGDSLVCADLRRFSRILDDAPVEGALLALPVEDSSRYGRIRVDDESDLIAFNEKAGGPGLINAGVYLLRKRAAAQFPDRRPLSFEMDVFPNLLRSGAKIRVEKVAAPFIDIGTESSLHAAGHFIKDNQGHFL